MMAISFAIGGWIVNDSIVKKSWKNEGKWPSSDAGLVSLYGREVKKINVQDFSDNYPANDVLIVDVREAALFKVSRLVNSVSIPHGEFQEYTYQQMLKNNPSKVIVLCRYSEECEERSSGLAVLSDCERYAQEVQQHEPSWNVHLLLGGIADVEKAGKAIDSELLP